MNVHVETTVNAPIADVWAVVTDIPNAAENISGVDDVEVLEKPAEGLVGLKWKETRTIGGRSATETMWITDVEEEGYYTTEARSHGAIYRTDIRLADAADGTLLSMEFGGEAQSLGAKIMSTVFGFMIKRSVKKALRKDLEDIKAAAESRKSK